MPADVIVYALANGRDYVACFDGDWFIWPAEADGWRRRQKIDSALAEERDDIEELPPRLADLALRLSGAHLG